MKTIGEIRHENLLLLVAEFGSQAEVARRAEIADVYISQILKRYPDAKTGRPRQMGDPAARKLEVGCNKPEGWMDNLHIYESSKYIALVMRAMEAMPEWQQMQTARIVGALTGDELHVQKT